MTFTRIPAWMRSAYSCLDEQATWGAGADQRFFWDGFGFNVLTYA
jgi:hypothetical protein